MSKLRLAVIGVGHLGMIHARLLSQLEDAELVGVVDPSPEARAAVAAELMVPACADHMSLIGQIDAAIIATPSRLHHGVAHDFLTHGVHVFVEKPMTLNIGDADDLIAEAESRRLILQVGHVERFNPALTAAAPHLAEPKYIDAVRSGPFTCRSTDIGVVLDLMIHDIDLIQELVGAPIESIDAVGASVFSGEIDIVNARIRFAGGCVANTTASRISMKQERKLRIFQDDAYLSIDLQQKILTVIRKKDAAPVESPAQVSIEEDSFDQGDALRAEIEAFLRSVRDGVPPVVSGEDGLRALETAMQITRLVQQSAR
jgi:predicted dehydrogenase